MSDIDRQMQQDGFWNNPQQNASVMQQRRSLERQLQTLNRLRSDADELTAWRELLEEGEADPELGQFLERLE
ncbi:MAG TPA: PCRF domain-containing protein, partial [Thermoanaerobaculia bacterium]